MKLQLNNYQIKILAALFMVCDHVGAVFFPNIGLFRDIGRLSFPLFAWLLTQGERYTRNFKQYLLRLVFLGLISQPLYLLALSGTKLNTLFTVFLGLINQPLYLLALSGTRLNILFTLFLGLITLRLSRQFAQFQYLIWGLGIVAAELLQVEYGAYGIAAICWVSAFRPNLVWCAVWIGIQDRKTS